MLQMLRAVRVALAAVAGYSGVWAQDGNSYMSSGGLEVALLSGGAIATHADPAAFHAQAELSAALTRRWSAFTSLTRVPEFVASGQTRQFEVFQGGTQRQMGFRRVGRWEVYPYVLAGVGRHSQRATLLTASQTVGPTTTDVRLVSIVGGGVRVLPSGNAPWGIRVEYRAMTPLRTAAWLHSFASAGIAIRIKP